MLGLMGITLLKSQSHQYFLSQNQFTSNTVYISLSSVTTLHSRETPTQIVYYDEVRRGNSIEDVDINVNPDLEFID